jgi:hypothetical protein
MEAAAKKAKGSATPTTTAAATDTTTDDDTSDNSDTTTSKTDTAEDAAEEVEVAVSEAKTMSPSETTEISTVLATESTRFTDWTLSVFIGTAVGFGLGYLVASLDRTFCRKRPEYASLLGDA